jgi:hypothetical protein
MCFDHLFNRFESFIFSPGPVFEVCHPYCLADFLVVEMEEILILHQLLPLHICQLHIFLQFCRLFILHFVIAEEFLQALVVVSERLLQIYLLVFNTHSSFGANEASQSRDADLVTTLKVLLKGNDSLLSANFG